MDVGAVLLDLQGVLYEAGAPFEGALDAVERLARAGLALRCLTNTTTRPLAEIAERMRAMGFAVDDGQIFTPAVAARGVLAERGITRLRLAADPALADDFAGYTLCSEGAEAVVLGDLERGFTWDLLNDLFATLRHGAILIALHKNRYCRRGDDLGLDLGPFVAALEYASRSDAFVVGKPSATFFEMALRDMGTRPEHTVMVGDDMDSDIGGGHGAGMATVQVRTGKYTKADDDVAVQPTYRIDSIRDLPDLLGLR